MERAKRLTFFVVFAVAFIVFTGCSVKKIKFSDLKGKWIVKQSIPDPAVWSDNQAKQLVGGELLLAADSVKFSYLSKKCGCDLSRAEFMDVELKNKIYFCFGKSEKSESEWEGYDLSKWGIQDQDAFESDLNSTNCPFHFLFFLKKDKKMIAVGEGAALLLERDLAAK